MLLDIDKVGKTLSELDNEAWGKEPVEKEA